MSVNHPQWDTLQLSRQASFLQSSTWARFQDYAGNKPHFLYGDGWSCLLLERKNRLGKYLFAPYGPTFDSVGALTAAVGEAKAYAKQHGADWLSVEPVSKAVNASEIRSQLRKTGATEATRNINPDFTRILDLRLSPDDLLASISQSTRSFIRKNQRETLLSFKTSTDPADISIFTHMLGLVAGRKRVSFFSEDYFKKQAGILMPAGMMFLELVYQQDKPIASAVMHDFGKICTYTYAASLPEARATSASALLLWQAILNAKARGIEELDLFGIAPDNATTSHPWYGFSAFKKKFGGEVIEHAGTWDIAISGKYKVYRSAKKTRRLLNRSH